MPLEKYLEEYIMKNWDIVDFGEKLFIYRDEDGTPGQQYVTDVGIMDILAKDEKLIDIFKSKKDVHTGVAMEVFGVQEKDVTKEMRRQAKVINFGMLYGMGVNALKQNLKTDRKTAQEFYNKYFLIYSDLANYISKTKEDASLKGYTETLFGRRRYFDGLKSSLPFIRAQAERMAINAPIQGTSADMIKMSMISIDKYLKENNLEDKVKLILQIHDEVVFEVQESVLNNENFQKDIVKIMSDVLPQEKSLGVPILVECYIGQNWSELK
jgi:DNA polymerase-1